MKTTKAMNIAFLLVSWVYWGIFYIGIRVNAITHQVSRTWLSSDEYLAVITGYAAILVCGTVLLSVQMLCRGLFPIHNVSLKRQLWRLIFFVVFSCCGMAIIISAIYYFFIFAGYYQTPSDVETILGYMRHYVTTILVLVVYILPPVVLYHFAILYQEFIVVTRERLEMQAFIKESEYERLKNQLNPHFLFNALNSIKALIRDEPSRAGEAIAILSDLLRSFLQTNERSIVPLQTEMTIVEDYIALEQLRFGDDLCFSWKVADDGGASILIPTLLIHTLVENAIKHGIGKLPFGGDIAVRVDIDSEAQILHIWIRNAAPRTATFPALLSEEKQNAHKQNTHKPNIGLRNVQRRLALLYGEQASLRFSIEASQNESKKDVIWANVRITLPVAFTPKFVDNSLPSTRQPFFTEHHAASSYRG